MTDPPAPPPGQNYTQYIIEQTRREYGDEMIASDGGNSSTKFSEAAPTQGSQMQLGQSAQEGSAPPTEDYHRPMEATPLTFATNTEKIMHFIRQAEYLSQPQIIALTGLQPSNASTALKKLVDTGQIKSLDDRRPKIYFVGRVCNPTTHNLLVRDLFVKINNSGFALRAVKFNDNLPEINRDLTVEFIGENSAPLFAYFELDRGTEGVGELVKKAERYASLPSRARVGFIFEKESDMQLTRQTIHYSFISYATIDQFGSLKDPAFHAGSEPPLNTIQLPFYR